MNRLLRNDIPRERQSERKGAEGCGRVLGADAGGVPSDATFHFPYCVVTAPLVVMAGQNGNSSARSRKIVICARVTSISGQ